jgi:hypothetical protein
LKSPIRIFDSAIFIIVALAGSSFSAARAQELLTNGSLENTPSGFINNGQGYMVLPAGSTAIAGWTVIGDQITWLLSGSQSFGSTPFGSLFVDLTGTHDNNSYGGIAQTISTTPGQTYTVSVSIGVNQNDAGGIGSKSVSVTAGSSGTAFTFTPTGTGMQWGSFNFSFVATTSSTSISILGTSSGTGNQSLFFDHVSVLAGFPTLTIAPATPGHVTISWLPDIPGYLLQESPRLSPVLWTNSPSGVTNPITIPTTSPDRFYRLLHP